ncbi:hypothetical protein RND71_038547 [Anisodus tanguticus]|uniref:Uncharacterized protein n=1 Tax=Anisodus tanguticus TaxID=243964 RepID=A0AAE1UX45_9SOLA|nr:hypothetical protein RND71_038547 [Anisodus tanguticus]
MGFATSCPHPSFIMRDLLQDQLDQRGRMGMPQIRHTFRETNAVADNLTMEGIKRAHLSSSILPCFARGTDLRLYFEYQNKAKPLQIFGNCENGQSP